jgi:7,8-dihydropterin-6-yl-methyl-4-(beta-D-ribofuranosyl)aminobenzene 5'-phosphate synthase
VELQAAIDTIGGAIRVWDAAGFLASALVAAFCMRDIVALRMVALVSNVAFLTYGLGLDLVPVWLSHATLLPVNGWRLDAWQRGGNMSSLHPPSAASVVSRRHLLCAGGAATFSSLVGGLLGGAKPARAQALGAAVPEVDRLAVRVVTDSFQLAIAPNMKVGAVEVQRFGMPPAGKSLLEEFGLSMHLESWRGNESRNLLLDFGFTSETLNNNLAMLGISPESIDALILSHGHYDHFGGLAGFLQQNRPRIRTGLPLYVGGEECFCSREWTVGKPQDFGALDRKALADAKVKVVFAEAPSVVADHAFTTGHIPVASFEKVLAPSRMTVGINNGVGCYPDKLPEAKRTATVIPDDFEHELATCFNVRGRGLVVLTSCSHRGVVSTVKRAMEISSVKTVHAVMGGFHLAPHKEEYVRETVAALKEINPDHVIPMHCTGEAFIDIAQKEMGGKFIRSYTGSRFIFGA